jgi:hypothetical protein
MAGPCANVLGTEISTPKKSACLRALLGSLHASPYYGPAHKNYSRHYSYFSQQLPPGEWRKGGHGYIFLKFVGKKKFIHVLPSSIPLGVIVAIVFSPTLWRIKKRKV